MPEQKDNTSLFALSTQDAFTKTTLKTFEFQYTNNLVYREFCDHLGKSPATISSLAAIPYLPIQFFKTHKVLSKNQVNPMAFTSSGTSKDGISTHFVSDISLYEKSYRTSFELFYGPLTDYCVLALLPSYLEREGSSLIHMVNDMVQRSQHADSGFYLNDLSKLKETLLRIIETGHKILLIGVSFALLDFAETHAFPLKNCILMETGGMKGRRKELVREELHMQLKKAFSISEVHSEYGMTELLSQAYSTGKGLFRTPPWMQISIRDSEDPLSVQQLGKTGGVNIIDLANRNSCSFIATQDLGKMHKDGSFEILGRFDHSDVRGCNLMVV